MFRLQKIIATSGFDGDANKNKRNEENAEKIDKKEKRSNIKQWHPLCPFSKRDAQIKIKQHIGPTVVVNNSADKGHDILSQHVINAEEKLLRGCALLTDLAVVRKDKAAREGFANIAPRPDKQTGIAAREIQTADELKDQRCHQPNKANGQHPLPARSAAQQLGFDHPEHIQKTSCRDQQKYNQHINPR